MKFKKTQIIPMKIESIARKTYHMDAVLDYCHSENIEPDTVARLISKGLKEKIEANARDLHFLPKHAKLPI